MNTKKHQRKTGRPEGLSKKELRILLTAYRIQLKKEKK